MQPNNPSKYADKPVKKAYNFSTLANNEIQVTIYHLDEFDNICDIDKLEPMSKQGLAIWLRKFTFNLLAGYHFHE